LKPNKSLINKSISIFMVALVLTVQSTTLALSCTQSNTAQTPSITPSSTTGIPTSTVASSPSPTPDTSVIDLAIWNNGFDKTTITGPQGGQVTINFNNEDAGVPDNLAIYNNANATTALFKGNTITGLAAAIYSFTAPWVTATYFFRDDNHPVSNGKFLVGSGAGGE
jgi:hypothetical protein